jgi:sugar lactone lactonase YvrE
MSHGFAAGLPRMSLWMDEIVFGESPRWHDGRLWFSDWGAGRIWSVTAGAEPVLEAEVEQLMCIDFLPDGRLLVVSPADGGVLLRRETDGTLVTHADLSAITRTGWNDVVADGSGRAYVNSIGFDFPGGEFAPGLVALVGPDGSARVVAEGLAFPNGMAVSPDGSTLVVAESYGEKLTAYPIADDGSLGDSRLWAATPGDHPDGICFDASGALWYADVGNEHCVRVREGGEVLDTVDSDRGAFACALSREGEPLLLVIGQEWGESAWGGPPTGQLVAFQAPEPGDGWP